MTDEARVRSAVRVLVLEARMFPDSAVPPGNHNPGSTWRETVFADGEDEAMRFWRTANTGIQDVLTGDWLAWAREIRSRRRPYVIAGGATALLAGVGVVWWYFRRR